MSDKERWFCTTCKEIRYQDEPKLYCTKCKGKTVVHREEAMFDEIERLRERDAIAVIANHSLMERIEELEKEIERLRAEIANDVIFKAQRERIEELEKQNGLLLGEIARRSEVHAKRIEELEKALRIAKVTLDAWDTDAITITTDQIRAAWREANATTHLKYQNVTLLRFLERHFNIVQCDCVDGCKTTPGNSASATDGGSYDPTRPCPDCNGDGFKIGGEDE